MTTPVGAITGTQSSTTDLVRTWYDQSTDGIHIEVESAQTCEHVAPHAVLIGVTFDDQDLELNVEKAKSLLEVLPTVIEAANAARDYKPN